MEDSHSPRRRFFKRAAIATLIGSIAAGIGFKAFAHGGYGGWHRGGFMGGSFDPAKVDEHLERMLKHLYVEIDASDEQQRKIAPIVKAAAKDLLPLRERMRMARSKGIELLTRDSIDRAALEALRVEQLQAADAATRRFAQALADLAEVLTPAQRKDLGAHFDRRHGRRWG